MLLAAPEREVKTCRLTALHVLTEPLARSSPPRQASVSVGDGTGKAAAFWRGHKLSVTALTLSSDDATAWSASKDGKIFQWDVESGKRTQLPDRPPNAIQGVRHRASARAGELVRAQRLSLTTPKHAPRA